MMSPSESYLASLADRLPHKELDAVEADIEREEGPAALFRCLEARLAAEVERGGSEQTILDTRNRLASAGERVALSQEDATAIQVALQTFEIWRELGDEEGCGRSACRALELAMQAREQVAEVIDALGGHEKALFWIRKNLRSKAIKKSPEKNAEIRHLAARMLEHAGEADAAFLELLGATRKMPSETTYIDEVYRLSLDTHRHEELTPIFYANASDNALPKAVRATLYMKIGYLEERCAERPERALEAFRNALSLRPKHKGTKRHVKRLEDLLKAEKKRAKASVSEGEDASVQAEAAQRRASEFDEALISPERSEEGFAADASAAATAEPEIIAPPAAEGDKLAHAQDPHSTDAHLPPALPENHDEAAAFEDADELDVLEEAPRVPSSASAQAKQDAEAAAIGALPPPLPSFDLSEDAAHLDSTPPAFVPESSIGSEGISVDGLGALDEAEVPQVSMPPEETNRERTSSAWQVTEAGNAFDDVVDLPTLQEAEAITGENTDESDLGARTSEHSGAGDVDDDTTAEALHSADAWQGEEDRAPAEESEANAGSATMLPDVGTSAEVSQQELPGTTDPGYALPPAIPPDELDLLEDADVESAEGSPEGNLALAVDAGSQDVDAPLELEATAGQLSPALRNSASDGLIVDTRAEVDTSSKNGDDDLPELEAGTVETEVAESVADPDDDLPELEDSAVEAVEGPDFDALSAALSAVAENDLSSALDSALEEAIDEAVVDLETSAADVLAEEKQASVPQAESAPAEQYIQADRSDGAPHVRDEEQRAQALAKLTARLPGGAATRRLLTRPNETLLEEGYAFYLDTRPEEMVELPFSVRILFAITLLRRGETDVALQILERLVQEQPTDLLCLRTLCDALEGNDQRAEERLDAVKNLLLHHKRVLNDADVLRYRATTGALQWRLGERETARATLQQTLLQAEEEQLHDAFTAEVASATVAALVDDATATVLPATRVLALRFLAEHRRELARAEALERAAKIAVEELNDVDQSRALLLQAIEAFPEGRSAPASLMELDIQDGDVEAAIATTKAFLLTEAEPGKRGSHHLRLAELYMQSQAPVFDIHTHLCGAAEFAGSRDAAIELAERFFRAEQNLAGLETFYADAVEGMKSAPREQRLQMWRKLVELRRDEFADLEGTAKALEQVAKLDVGSIGPREECARIYMQLGRLKEAVATWRAILERAPLAKRAWRGLFSAYVSHGQGDEAFAVAAAMASIELADEAMLRAVRLAAPEFPNWPQIPEDPTRLRKRLSHPLETPLLQQIFSAVGGAIHRSQAATLKDYGLRKRDMLTDKSLPPSVVGAVGKISAMLGLDAPPVLYASPYGSADGRGSDFALLPVAEPSLLVGDEVVQNGMTPERAFAMGRAMAWLAPQAILAGTLSAPQLTDVLESLVELLLGTGRGRGDAATLREGAARLESILFGAAAAGSTAALRDTLTELLTEYDANRERIHLVDWLAGVGYTADRIGFLLVGDVMPATRVIKSTAGEAQTLGARLAIKELVLFSASSVYLSLRQQLGLALSPKDTAPILRLR